MRRSIGFLAVLMTTVALSTSACGDDDPPTSPTPSTDPPIVTETFTGAMNPNGAVTHPFSTEAAGVVTATLITVAPDSSTRVGLAIGTWNGLACKIELANDNAAQGVTVTGSASAFGSFCVRIYDIGQLTGNITYEIRLTHP
ncbi:MAG TPA: hypothetical protein VMM93_04405 [Vicinamibacterales bacterium]|nr:hypothetical protein [Vicinamibacterales bacterium]